MHVAQDTLTERLRAAIRQAEDLMPTLARLLAEADTGGPRTGTIGRHAPESREPWNPAVADALWDLWIGPGRLVAVMRRHLGLQPWAVDPHGPYATSALAALAVACPPEVVKLAVLRLERWVSRAQQLPAVDEAEPWTALPVVGARPPACPYCRTFGLRMRRRAGEVRCFYPGCTDADDRPTRARMESGRMTGEECLIFGDGTMMAFEGSA